VALLSITGCGVRHDVSRTTTVASVLLLLLLLLHTSVGPTNINSGRATHFYAASRHSMLACLPPWRCLTYLPSMMLPSNEDSNATSLMGMGSLLRDLPMVRTTLNTIEETFFNVNIHTLWLSQQVLTHIVMEII
jgi:hypothetical protein